MRPLTPRRILAICGMLAAILFVVVVISLRVGAYPIGMRDIVITLYNRRRRQRTTVRNSAR